MQRDTKLGHGFLWLGLGVAYLLGLLLGQVWGIVLAVSFVFVGVFFLTYGYYHSEDKIVQAASRKITIRILVPFLELGLAISGIAYLFCLQRRLSPDALKVPAMPAQYQLPKIPNFALDKTSLKPLEHKIPRKDVPASQNNLPNRPNPLDPYDVLKF